MDRNQNIRMILKPHTDTVIVKGRLCSGKLAEGTEINVSNRSAVKWHEVSGAVPGVVMRFGRTPWRQTLLGWLARVLWTPMNGFSVASPMNPKDFLEVCGLLRTTAAAGLKETKRGLMSAWCWSRVRSLPFWCSSSAPCVAKSFWLAPMMVCGFVTLGRGAWAPLAALAWQNTNLPGLRGESLRQQSFLWGSSKSPRAVALC